MTERRFEERSVPKGFNRGFIGMSLLEACFWILHICKHFFCRYNAVAVFIVPIAFIFVFYVEYHPMNICLFTSEEITKPLSKNDERAKHIKKVLHKQAGDTFDAGIIGGAAGVATITEISDDGDIFFDFEPKSAGKKLYPLTLIIGFPRPIQLRRLLRDVAGLGVKKVILCGTDLTEKSYLDSNVVSDGSARQMLLDGTAQAASTHVPELKFEKSLDELLKSETESTEWEMSSKIALDNRRNTCSLHDFLTHESAHSVIAAIGSERGWTERERDMLENSGFSLCSMGSRILRTETAATVASSIILDAMGFLD